jgi:tetratricopeptide (TPR) repeat protein
MERTERFMTTTKLAVVALVLLAVPAFADKAVDDAVARAEAQLQKGKPDEAIKILDKKAKEAGSPEAYSALARLQQRIGKFDDAAASAAKAVEAGRSAAPAARSEALATLAALDLARGSAKDAVNHAKEAVNADANPAALAVLARAQARVEGGKAALETADKATAAAATSAAAHEARGEALLALGRNEEAAAAARKALELDAQATSARVVLANALMAQGKNAEAVAEAKKATEANAQSDEAFAAYGLALLAQDAKNWNEAIAAAQQGAFLNPSNPVVQVAVGRIFEAQGNLDQATSAYRKALEKDPTNAGARRALISLQERRGDVEGALAEARKLAAEAPQSGDAQLQLGRLLMRKNEFNEAVKPLELAAASSGVAEAHVLLGTAYQNMGRYADAAASYKKAVELDPKNIDYRTTYGLFLGLAGQYEPGIAELKKVIATPGYKDAAAYANLGWIYRNMKPPRPEEAVNAYKKAAELDPKNAQVALGLAWAYLKANRFDDAIATYERLRQLDPKMEAEAENGLGWSYAFKKDVAQARAHAEKAEKVGRNVAALKTQIDRVEKGLAAEAAAEEEEAAPPVQRGPDVPSLTQTLLYSRDMGARVRAARQLVPFGAAAVPSLINALKEEQPVREAAVVALGAIGPPAKAAVPHLKHILSTREHEKINMTKEEMMEAMREEDFRKMVRDAILRIGS